MTEYQENECRILSVFKRICDENKLRYWLIGGTLLGAVRHKGFIPWDDDIDVAMPADDYEMFLSLEGTLPEPYCIQNKVNDPYYPMLFTKMCDKSKPFPHNGKRGPKGCYIDIFPFEYCKFPSSLQKLRFNAANVISYVLQIKLGWKKAKPYNKIPAKIAYYAMCLLSPGQLRNIRIKLLEGIRSETKSAYLMSPAGTYKADYEFYPALWFEDSTSMEFENQFFSCPVGWDEYLSRNYGDYLTLPPESERVARHSQE